MSAHAVLVATLAAAAAGRPATLARITRPAEPRLPRGTRLPDAVRVVELQAASAEAAVQAACEAATARDREGWLILDLPAECLAAPSLRAHLDAAVLPVGPTPLDEHFAAAVLGDPRLVPPVQAGPPAPVWLLGCGRSGGEPAVARFERSMRAAVRTGAPDAADAIRALPVALPRLGPSDAAGLVVGTLTSRLLCQGLHLIAAIEAAARHPSAAPLRRQDLAESPGPAPSAAGGADHRDTGERLRDLAEALEAIEEGAGPSPQDLADAPLLEDWDVGLRAVRALTGVVSGHPDFPRPCRIRTSEVYASDGRTWVRTYSRWYRLGRAVGDTAPTTLQ
ncbi:DUF6634 family protein [Methylobacterium oxalidis]|uniref:DUF6634 family protein n=1 Tax=Methylobacterium oxalidis TaxID=944322 RepID=UPI003315E195